MQQNPPKASLNFMINVELSHIPKFKTSVCELIHLYITIFSLWLHKFP